MVISGFPSPGYTEDGLVATVLHALLVVARGGVIGVNDGVRGDAVGVARLSPGVDGVNIAEEGRDVIAVRVEGKHGERLLQINEVADGSEPENNTYQKTITENLLIIDCRYAS